METNLRELSPVEKAEVRSKYPNVYFPEPVLEPIWYGRRDHVRVMDKRAIVDQASENRTVFGICSDQYKIVPFEDTISLVQQTVDGITGFGKIDVNPHTYLDGARLRVGISFPDKKTLITKVDSIVPKMDVFSSHDLSTKLMGKFGAFQLKCTNGMGVWKTFKQFAKRHLQNLFLEELGISIGEGLEVFDVQIGLWKKWAETKISQKFYEEIWSDLPFSLAEKAKIEVLPEIDTKMLISEALKSNDLNLWGLNSVLTQFATHEVSSELRRIQLEPEIAKSMELAYNILR
jgi:hypothetical protein